MKTKLFLAVLSLTFLLQNCSPATETYKDLIREVRFFKGTIHDVNRKVVTLTNGSSWITNRIIIAVNLTEVFFVLESLLDNGYMYLNGTKIPVKHNSISGSDDFRYQYGYLNCIKNFDSKNGVVELSDGSLWLVYKDDEPVVAKWLSTREVVIPENEMYMINPYKIKSIRVRKIQKGESDTTIF